jgi:UDP-N-acetylglucosamine 1-carboxyvinyltransferase
MSTENRIVIEGPSRLLGEVSIFGSKNASLALIAASLLSRDGLVQISNIPGISDIEDMVAIAQQIGIRIADLQGSMVIDTNSMSDFVDISVDLTRKIRASVYFLGVLIGLRKEGLIGLPGGDSFAPRPIDFHLEGLRLLGARITATDNQVSFASKTLRGADIILPFPSIGATCNLLMASCVASGTTQIKNAAHDFEVQELCHFLVRMGAKIRGIGTSELVVEGVEKLHGCEYSVMPDRTETVTFLVAAAITAGSVDVRRCNPNHVISAIELLQHVGARISYCRESIHIEAPDNLKLFNARFGPPPLPFTDWQPLFTVLGTQCKGTSALHEGFHLSRFTHIEPLSLMGAQIIVQDRQLTIYGKTKLEGKSVVGTDIRCATSLVLAGLAANGTTCLLNAHHVDRGHEHLERRLEGLGARIIRT